MKNILWNTVKLIVTSICIIYLASVGTWWTYIIATLGIAVIYIAGFLDGQEIEKRYADKVIKSADELINKQSGMIDRMYQINQELARLSDERDKVYEAIIADLHAKDAIQNN